MQKINLRFLFRVCKIYGLLFLFGIILGAGFVLSPIFFGHFTEERQILHAAELKGDLQANKEDQNIPNSSAPADNPNSDSDQDLNPNANPNSNQNQNQNQIPNPTPKPVDKVQIESNAERISLLMIGVDRRPNEKSISNTDTLIVASVNLKNGNIALISIPRDTQITIPGYGKTKINAAARIGNGLDSTCKVVQGLIGQRIDGYVLTNFTGFKEVIDTLGGVTINVEKDMYYVTGDKQDGVINLKKGVQHLQGAQALEYARFRQDQLGDISRTTRQQAVLKAVGKEFLQVSTIPKMPWLVPEIMKSVETNIPLSKIWSLANIILRYRTPKITSQTLPGSFLTEDGISYWQVDSERSKAVVKRLFEEGKTSSVFFK